MASGKQPERNNDNVPPTSLISRIGASANALTRSAFTGSSTDHHTLSSLSNGEGKAGSSSAAAQDTTSSSQSYPPTFVSTSRSEGFRSQAPTSGCDAHPAQRAFNEFLDPDQGNLVGYDQPLTGQQTALSDDMQTAWVSEIEHGSKIVSKSADGSNSMTASQGRYGDHDGAAVVALLSDSSFNAFNDPISTWDQPEDDPATIFDAREEALKHSSVDEIKSGLFDPTEDVWSHNDPGPWQELLNRYHDEVWGDQLPLVKEARKEVQQAVAGGELHASELPALRRLRMVLGHVRPPG